MAPTEDTLKRTYHFLDYAVTHPDAILTYTTRDMVLEFHSDVSYLSEPNTRSRTGGNLFLLGYTINPTNNGAVLNITQIIKSVMTSVAGDELGALFMNIGEAVPQLMTLEEMGHPNPPTPMQTDKSTNWEL